MANQYCIHEYAERRLNLWNAGRYTVPNPLPYCMKPKNIKIKISE
jgi:hypothetical protein